LFVSEIGDGKSSIANDGARGLIYESDGDRMIVVVIAQFLLG